VSSTSVLLTSDGTYPCYQGGVSVWCDQLVHQLSAVEYHLFAISYSPSHPPLFDLPPNVISSRILPLWGTDQPGDLIGPEQDHTVRIPATSAIVRDLFVEPFRTFLCSLGLHSSPESLATSLVRLHELLLVYDYLSVMKSDILWDVFCECTREVIPDTRMMLEDCTQSMRWLQRYLALLCINYPRTDVTHSSMSCMAGVPGVLQKFRYQTPFLLSEHGIYLRELYLSISRMECSDACKRFLYNLNSSIVRMNYHYADLVTSLCDFNSRWQIRFGVDRSRIAVIPNGIDAERFYPGPPRNESSPVVLTMARIYPLKGIIHLIHAARLVLNRIPSVRFRIFGDVADTAYYKECSEAVSKLGLSHAVEFGRTDDSARAYREADVFCLPSVSEAMPFSVLEAMFSGCPVVASEVGGIPEMIEGVGVLVTPGDEQDLASALISLLDGEQGQRRRHRIASLALSRARLRYVQGQCSSKFEEIYREFSARHVTSEVSTSRVVRRHMVAAP